MPLSGKEKSKNGASKGPERRAHPRYASPVLVVAIADQLLSTENWSMSNMALVGYKGPLSVGAIFQVTAMGKADNKGKLDKVNVSARVTRSDAGMLAFSFLELDQSLDQIW